MKFINYLESITGIGVYPLISLVIFFGFFAAVTLFVIKGRKEYFEYLRNIPINNQNSEL
jgi:cytochrome c oxidase cbb3-type subunit IV